jgi:chromosome segregation ATPase
MVTGRDNFEVINQQVFQAQTRLEETSRRLEEWHRQLDALRLEMSNGYRELAKLRLDPLQAGEVISRLNESDQALFILIQDLKRHRLNLKERLEASISRRQQLEGERKELARQRDEAITARQQQLAQTHKRISETEGYRQQQERTQNAGEVARQAAEADGVLTWQAKVQEAEKQLKQCEAELAAEELRHQKLLAEEAGWNAGTDPISAQILDLQAEALAKEPVASLYEKARDTPRPDDDVAGARIQQLRQRQEQTTREIQSLNAILQQQQRTLGELEEVRRRYRQSGYDASNSRFPSTFALAVLLGRMLDGLANPDTVWGEIERNQRGSGHGGGWDGGFGGSGEPGGGFGGGEGDFYTKDSF